MATFKKTYGQESAAGQQISKYYIRHEEDPGKTTVERSTDGYTLYRAMARQVLGDPSRFLDIRNAVLHFYLRVYANKLHPLHDECMGLDALLLKQHKKQHKEKDPGTRLFPLLDCPDLNPQEQVLWDIAYALKVRIDVYSTLSTHGEPQGLIHSVGPQGRPVCTVLRSEKSLWYFDESGFVGTRYHFSSLLPDNSGKALIEYLLKEKERSANSPRALQIKQMSWAWKKSPGKEFWTCFNEYRTESKIKDLKYKNAQDRMDTFVVTVNTSRHVLPALKLFHEALRRAPYQRQWVRHSHNTDAGFMLPHCSVDAEFVKMERGLAEEKGEEAKDAVHEGELEELCSVLTFAVGRHFFLVFNIAHMLETSDEHTVPALSTLFRETIFNKDILKLWWNPQSDITVFDATIAHMFQKTPRESYIHSPHNSVFEFEITPRWRIRRDDLQNTRPDDLKFPIEDADCELHRWGTNEQGIACCCRLGNVDIAALLTHWANMHGMANSVECKKRPWSEHRHRYRYGDLLYDMLHSDRLYPILSYMKDRAGSTGKGRSAFYQDMGQPGMELEDDVMAYNIGDVAGQNLIFEQLMFSDDKKFVAGCLSGYGKGGFRGSSSRAVPQRPSAFESVGGVRLWEDNPRSFTDTTIATNIIHHMPPTAVLYQTPSLLPWEHDERVHLMRTKPPIDLQKDETHDSGAYVQPKKAYGTAKARQREIRIQTHVSTRLPVSAECVQKADPVYEDPIVRAGTTHSEALLELLQSSKRSATTPPKGFGASKGDADGLPAWLDRVPGQGLDQARNLFEAFPRHDSSLCENLGEEQPLPPATRGWEMTGPPDLDAVFEGAWEAEKDNDP